MDPVIQWSKGYSVILERQYWRSFFVHCVQITDNFLLLLICFGESKIWYCFLYNFYYNIIWKHTDRLVFMQDYKTNYNYFIYPTLCNGYTEWMCYPFNI